MTITRIESIKHYRIYRVGRTLVLADNIGQVYGRGGGIQRLRKMAAHLLNAERAQRRELQQWDGSTPE